MNLPQGNQLPNYDFNFSFIVDSIYFHRSTYYYNNVGANLLDTFGIDLGSVINVFLFI